LVAGLAGVLVVAGPEAVTWYHEAGVFILDGDVPPGGISGPGEAVGDALTSVTFFYLLFSSAWPVIGAGLGAWRRRQPRPAAPAYAALGPDTSPPSDVLEGETWKPPASDRTTASRLLGTT
jgi:hypothetical protein